MSKTSKHLLPIMVMGIFVLFFGTSIAQAGCAVETWCVNDMGWTVALINDSDELDALAPGDHPPPPAPYPMGPCDITLGDNSVVAVEECYRWNYQVTNPDGTTSGLGHVNFTIPVDCPEILIGNATGAQMAVYEPGAGDPSTMLGKGIEEIFVIHFSPNNDEGIWSFVANTKKMAMATSALSIKNKVPTCPIAGPNNNGDDPNEILIFTAAVIVGTSDGKQFKIIEDADTGCILAGFEKYCPGVSDPECHEDWETVADETECCWKPMKKRKTGDVLRAVGDGWEVPVEYVGGHTNRQKCNRSIVKSKGDHTWYFASGDWFWF